MNRYVEMGDALSILIDAMADGEAKYIKKSEEAVNRTIKKIKDDLMISSVDLTDYKLVPLIMLEDSISLDDISDDAENVEVSDEQL